MKISPRLKRVANHGGEGCGSDELEWAIPKLRKLYYNGTPLCDDRTFDLIERRLRVTRPDSPVLKQVGAPATGATPLGKVKHKIPMTSLDNAIGVDAFKKWAKKFPGHEFVMQPKLDGLSVELWYKDGTLVDAVTRGDGAEGDSVFHSMTHCRDVPPFIDAEGEVYVRGEAMIMRNDFEKYFGDMANPRNAAAGTVRRTDTSRAKHLSFFAFDMTGGNMDSPTIIADEAEKIETLRRLKFRTVRVSPVNCIAAFKCSPRVFKCEHILINLIPVC